MDLRGNSPFLPLPPPPLPPPSLLRRPCSECKIHSAVRSCFLVLSLPSFFQIRDFSLLFPPSTSVCHYDATSNFGLGTGRWGTRTNIGLVIIQLPHLPISAIAASAMYLRSGTHIALLFCSTCYVKGHFFLSIIVALFTNCTKVITVILWLTLFHCH